MRKLLLAATVIALAAPVAFSQYKVDTPKSGTRPTVPSSNNGALQITTPSQTETALATAPRISRDEARKLVKAGKAVFIDVRSTATYEAGHLPGALSFPGSQLVNRLKDLPLGKKLITYCACVEEHTAAVAVLNMHAHRLDNSAALVGGWNDWKAAGLPIEFGPQAAVAKR